MAGALDGITVVDLTTGMAGALATMLLCDNGARVIRLEPPDGRPERRRPGYAVWDRGKESVILDLSPALEQRDVSQVVGAGGPRACRELDLFHGLVGMADVLVESFAPSSAYQRVVDYDGLASINPGLVHCSITAYGKAGPLRDRDDAPDLVKARLGVLAVQPASRPGPVHVMNPLPSVGAGALAALGIVASLYAREKAGRGRKVETSLIQGALLYSNKVVGERLSRRRRQTSPTGDLPFYSAYECADGDWIQLACIHSGFVDLAAAVMGVAEMLVEMGLGDGGVPESDEARKRLSDMVAGVMKTKPYREWAALFEEADVPYARVCTSQEAMDDPQVRFNEMVVELEDPELGLVSQMGLPVKLARTPGRVRGPRPPPGQDGEKLLAELDSRPIPKMHASHSQGDALEPPLKGVGVMEITNVIAGPSAGKLLSELGADVVKVEPLEGDFSRPAAGEYFYYLNLNKRSVSVNARTPEGKEVVRGLVAQEDVLLANLRPGATDRMGLGSEVLEGLNPRLVEVHVTAYGPAGPYVTRPGLDPLIQAMVGLERIQGGPQGPPVFMARLAPADYTAGALAALGTVMALFVRERTGLSQRVDVSLLGSGIVVASENFMRYEGSGGQTVAGGDQYGLGALHRVYETSKGWLYLIAEGDEEWPALCEALGRGDLCHDSRFASPQARLESDSALADELARTFRSRSSQEWLRTLEEANVSCAPVVEGYERGFFADPHAMANDLIVENQHPTVGLLKTSGNSIGFGGTPPIRSRPPPLLGQHTREVLRELGYAQGQIDELYDKGVVKTEASSE